MLRSLLLSSHLLTFWLKDYVHLEAQGNPIIALDNDFTGPRFEMYKELATAAKKHGSLLVGQVSHAGRQVNVRIVS